MRSDAKRDATKLGNRRGVAMLLVMVGLVVCTLLTAGFLSTQGTAIAIARNERDAEACRLLAQAGLDLCFAQMRTLDAARTTADQPSWREKMSPGTWLSNFPVGNGTVTVTAASANGATSFSSDPHQAVVFTSTGACNNRSFTLTGTYTPTGGGQVFRGGNYFQGTVVVGPGTLLVPTLIDSYNSSQGAYSTSGSKAIVWTNSTAGGSVTINTFGSINGSVVAGPLALVSNVLNGVLGLLGLGGGGTVASASETRDPGVVIPPNMSGMTSQGSVSASTSTFSPGVFDNLTFPTRSGGYTITGGFYGVNDNLTINSSTKLTTQAASNVVMYVKGNLSLASSSAIVLGAGSTLTIYVGGGTSLSAASINATGTNPLPSAVQLLGLPNAAGIQLSNGSKLYGVIYSPNSSVSMQGTAASPAVYGAIVAHDVAMQNMSQFHYDQATQSIKIDNIAGGTAPPGAADYKSTVVGTNNN